MAAAQAAAEAAMREADAQLAAERSSHLPHHQISDHDLASDQQRMSEQRLQQLEEKAAMQFFEQQQQQQLQQQHQQCPADGEYHSEYDYRGESPQAHSSRGNCRSQEEQHLQLMQEMEMSGLTQQDHAQIAAEQHLLQELSAQHANVDSNEQAQFFHEVMTMGGGDPAQANQLLHLLTQQQQKQQQEEELAAANAAFAAQPDEHFLTIAQNGKKIFCIFSHLVLLRITRLGLVLATVAC